MRGTTSGRPAEGLALLRSWRPAAVVLDVVLPGLDATEFRAMQMDVPAARDVPVLLLSATHAQTLDRIAADVGAAAWLAKPFELDAFLGAVARLVDR